MNPKQIKSFEKRIAELLQKANLGAIINANHDFSGITILEKLNEISYLRQLYEYHNNKATGETIKTHTIKVLNNFSRFFENFESTILTKNEMCILLCLHDIGKPLAMEHDSTSTTQHRYTGIIMSKVLERSGLSDQKIKILAGIGANDTFGKFIQGINTEKQTSDIILKETDKLQADPKEYLKLLQTYFICDAGAYTQFAGSAHTLDYQFTVATDKKSLTLSPKLTAKTRKLGRLLL